MASFIDKLKPEDQEWARNRAKAALNPEHRGEIPPELYQIAMFGLNFGFEGVKAALVGHFTYTEKDGTTKYFLLDKETLIGLNNAARKVRYRQLVDAGDLQAASIAGMEGDQTFRSQVISKTNQMRKDY